MFSSTRTFRNTWCTQDFEKRNPLWRITPQTRCHHHCHHHSCHFHSSVDGAWTLIGPVRNVSLLHCSVLLPASLMLSILPLHCLVSLQNIPKEHREPDELHDLKAKMMIPVFSLRIINSKESETLTSIGQR